MYVCMHACTYQVLYVCLTLFLRIIMSKWTTRTPALPYPKHAGTHAEPLYTVYHVTLSLWEVNYSKVTNNVGCEFKLQSLKEVGPEQNNEQRLLDRTLVSFSFLSV